MVIVGLINGVFEVLTCCQRVRLLRYENKQEAKIVVINTSNTKTFKRKRVTQKNGSLVQSHWPATEVTLSLWTAGH